MRLAYASILCLAGCGTVTAKNQPDGGAPDAATSRTDARPGAPDATAGAPDATSPADAGPGSFSLTILGPASGILVAGNGTLTLNLALTRTAPFTGSVSVSIAGLQSGVTATSLLLNTGDSGGSITLSAASDAAQGTYHGSIVGTAVVGTKSTPFDLTVRGAAGTLDTSLDPPAGSLQTTISGRGTAIGFQSDGRMIVAGDYQVFRLLADGSDVDATFGSSTGVTPGQFINAMRVQPDDKVVVLDSTATIRRYDADGNLDDTFGSSGAVSLTSLLSTGVTPDDLVVQPTTGDLIIACSLNNNYYYYYLVALTPSGAQDTSLDTNGLTQNYLYSTDSLLTPIQLAMQPNGQPVALVTADDSVYVVRHDADLQMDATFGSSGGYVSFFEGSGASVNRTALSIEASGTIAVAAYVYDTSSSTDFTLLATVNDKGTTGLDTTITVAPMFGMEAMVTQGTSYLVGGTDSTDVTVQRYGSTGTADASFGTVTLPWSDLGLLAVDPNGELVVAGSASGDVVVSRYWL